MSTTQTRTHIAVRLDNWKALGLFQEYFDDPQNTRAAFLKNMYFTGDKNLIV